MTNAEISDLLSLYSKLMDIHQENSFKVKSYANAAFQIDRLTDELKGMTEPEISSTRGIGKGIASHVLEILHSKKLGALEDLIAKTPLGVMELLNIKGIGPKKITQLWHELLIESPGELLYACQENRLVHYKGFGIKTQQSIQEAIEFYFSNQSRFLYSKIEPVAYKLLQWLETTFQGCKVALTGQFTRQCEIIDQLEYVLALDPDSVIQAFESEALFVFNKEEAGTLYFTYNKNLMIEITCCEAETFTETFFFTLNTSDFNEAFQEKFPDVIYSGEEANDEEIFEQAGIPYIHVCLRDKEEILDAAVKHKLPHLITDNDIHGVIHNHSIWSDGGESIEKMAQECMRLGYEYLVMSDHSVTSFYANGLQVERIKAQHEEIDTLNDQLKPFKIFKSIECDILSEGQLDYTDDVLASFDLVIASVHQNLNMTEEKAMKRVITAIQNPYTTVLGHASGRLLLSRKAYPLNYEMVVEECAKQQVVIEINANPRRLDLDWRYIELAKKNKVLLSINPDAHSLAGIRDIRYGVLAAQKGGLQKNENLSSFTLKEFEEYLEKRSLMKNL